MKKDEGIMTRTILILSLLFVTVSVNAIEVERLQYDLDGDGKTDDIILSTPENWVDAGEFMRVDFHFGNGSKRSLEGSSGWVSYSESADKQLVDWFRQHNLLPSQRLVLLDDTEGGILFLFGYAYASSPGELTVVSFYHNDIRTIFKGNFWPEMIETSPESIKMTGKQCFTYAWGIDLKCRTYDPYQVIQLTAESAQLDKVQTRDYNIKHYFGYVGPDCSEEYAVVEINGNKMVVDPKTAHAICTDSSTQ